MNKIHTDKAPAAIGPYSQAIEANGMIYVSGQIPINPATGDIVEGDIADKTRQCMKNISAILEAAGSSLDKIVKTTVYCTDLGDFATINAAYAEFFGDVAPARGCVQVAALPKNVPVEIEAIACK